MISSADLDCDDGGAGGGGWERPLSIMLTLNGLLSWGRTCCTDFVCPTFVREQYDVYILIFVKLTVCLLRRKLDPLSDTLVGGVSCWPIDCQSPVAVKYAYRTINLTLFRKDFSVLEVLRWRSGADDILSSGNGL